MKVKNNFKILFLIVFLSILFLPSKVFGADKTYYWSSNLSEYSCNLFQEDVETELETDGYIAMTPLGSYKFIFYNGKNYMAMNSGYAGYSTDVDVVLNAMEPTIKNEDFHFTQFMDTEDYTPKTYKDMLKRAKIYVYDKNNNLVQSMGALNYKNYMKFPSNNKFKATFDKYINDGDSVTGVSVKLAWSFPEGENPIVLQIINDKIDFEQTFDMQTYTNKSSIEAALNLQYNGTYTFIMSTNEKEYTQELKFTKLALDVLSDKEKEEDITYTEGDEIDDSDIKITVDGIPNKKVSKGNSFQLVITTNVPTNVNFSDRVDSTYQKKHKFNITENGTYTILATSEAGKSAEKKIKINCFVEPKDDGKEYYSRDAYWTGDPTDLGDSETLAQTGMYDSTLLVLGILAIFAALLIFAELIRKEGLTWKRK